MKPSTKLGNGLGHLSRVIVWVADYAIPLAVVSAYRLIPDHTRGKLFGGPSTSLSAVSAMRQTGGAGWQIIHTAMSNHPPHPHLP